MYTAADALKDLDSILGAEYIAYVYEEIFRLLNYLEEQKLKEKIPELLRSKDGSMHRKDCS